MSERHLQKHVDELAFRYNQRATSTSMVSSRTLRDFLDEGVEFLFVVEVRGWCLGLSMVGSIFPICLGQPLCLCYPQKLCLSARILDKNCQVIYNYKR